MKRNSFHSTNKTTNKELRYFYDFLLSSCRLFSCFIKVTLKRLYGFLSFTDRYLGCVTPPIYTTQFSWVIFFSFLFYLLQFHLKIFMIKHHFTKSFLLKRKAIFCELSIEERAIALISSYPIMAGISFKLMELKFHLKIFFKGFLHFLFFFFYVGWVKKGRLPYYYITNYVYFIHTLSSHAYVIKFFEKFL